MSVYADVNVTVMLVVATHPASEKVYFVNAWRRFSPFGENLSEFFSSKLSKCY